jgi:hypothetical protein
MAAGDGEVGAAALGAEQDAIARAAAAVSNRRMQGKRSRLGGVTGNGRDWEEGVVLGLGRRLLEVWMGGGLCKLGLDIRTCVW